MEQLDLLVSLDENYLPQLRVMLTSLILNDPDVRLRVFFLHRAVPEAALDELGRALARHGHELVPVRVDDRLFEGAPVNRYYSQEMYYRLLAAQLLPPDVDRVLYLDPDILVINPLTELWHTDMNGALFAAASHSGRAELADGVNRVRLGTDHPYYNSGVLLIDLAQCRSEIHAAEIFEYVADNAAELLLPDQDVLNALYGNRIQPVDDLLWNYDARNYADYFMFTHGEASVPWVMEHTAILHFCGRAKPWKPNYRHRFGVLYRHYMQLEKRLL